MTYQKPATDSIPVFLANVESVTEQQEAVARGWVGDFHTSGVVDQAWLDELGAKKCFITFKAADFTGTALSTAGQTKASLLITGDNAAKVHGIDIDYSDEGAIASVVTGVQSQIKVFWKNDVAPATHTGWSRNWFWRKTNVATTNRSVDFDPETDTLVALKNWYRSNANRDFCVYCQAKGVPMAASASTGLGELILPGLNTMSEQLLLCHTQSAFAIILDGNRDHDGVTFESKIVGGDTTLAAHYQHMIRAYADYKIRDANQAPQFSQQHSGYARPDVGVVT